MMAPLKKHIIALLTLLVLLAACQAMPTPKPTPPHLPTPTQTPSPQPSAAPLPTAMLVPTSEPAPEGCSEKTGTFTAVDLHSPVLDGNAPLLIYTPPCYEAENSTHYPVLYLLHGQEYNQDQFKDLGLAQAADALAEQGRAMIIIMPKMPDYNTPVEQLTLEYFEKDLIPYIDETFRTLASKEARAVGGISRGANWAVRVGIEFPLLFGKIGLHSVALSNLESGALSARIGGLKPESRPELYIDMGSEDEDFQLGYYFDHRLNQLAIPHIWFVGTGGHTDDYWQRNLPDYLNWYSKDW